MTASCPMLLHNYPLDKQVCKLAFESCEFGFQVLARVSVAISVSIKQTRVPIINPLQVSAPRFVGHPFMTQSKKHQYHVYI